MLWLLISLFFGWCAFREIRGAWVAPPGYALPTPITKSYLALVTGLALLFAWPPVHIWYFERFLSVRATLLADNHPARIHCNSTFDTMMAQEMLAAAYTHIETGTVNFQKPWCDRLISYLRHPAEASSLELDSLDAFTHESMHVRGERNEAVTECEAVQRNYRAAKLLGVADAIARRNALDYYTREYLRMASIGGMQSAYHSTECAPGGALDEHLSDSTWAEP
jgi:hypothetical protein